MTPVQSGRDKHGPAMPLTGHQFRDARFRAGLELGDLADRTGIDHQRLAYAKAMYGTPAWTEEEFARVRITLEAAGVMLIAENGEGAGVRLRRGRT